jgi:hypothetical protein
MAGRGHSSDWLSHPHSNHGLRLVRTVGSCQGVTRSGRLVQRPMWRWTQPLRPVCGDGSSSSICKVSLGSRPQSAMNAYAIASGIQYVPGMLLC